MNINGDGDVDLIGSHLAQVFVFAADGDDTVRATGGAGTGDRWLPPRWGYLWASGGQGDDVLIGTRRGDGRGRTPRAEFASTGPAVANS